MVNMSIDLAIASEACQEVCRYRRVSSWSSVSRHTEKPALVPPLLTVRRSVAVSLLRLIFTERLARFGFDPNTDAIRELVASDCTAPPISLTQSQY